MSDWMKPFAIPSMPPLTDSLADQTSELDKQILRALSALPPQDNQHYLAEPSAIRFPKTQTEVMHSPNLGTSGNLTDCVQALNIAELRTLRGELCDMLQQVEMWIQLKTPMLSSSSTSTGHAVFPPSLDAFAPMMSDMSNLPKTDLPSVSPCSEPSIADVSTLPHFGNLRQLPRRRYRTNGVMNPFVTDHGKYVCPYANCGRIYAYLANYRSHARIHTNPHTCQYCGKQFGRKGNLTSHLKVHERRDKPFECSRCHKQLATKEQWMQHAEKECNMMSG